MKDYYIAIWIMKSEVQLNLDNEIDNHSFDVEETSHMKEVQLEVNLTDSVLVDKDRLEELEKAEDELEEFKND
ncbi:hypothetical protein J2Z83_003779 [Virgibacillus natechei]|uniref:Uncharacterized protein n=1 Tax=Virgibacillus natechei TaxID=1216297 RepID=A0ABS4IKY9_9BACI|nr:hypothetical protein [Virgibacillus natechei]MBP1971628.1 hypothetical protein [Virgibacillus natechei]UZD13045.1 hypothetical protein OLD84_00250 [Virgibacillus natechei]